MDIFAVGLAVVSINFLQATALAGIAKAFNCEAVMEVTPRRIRLRFRPEQRRRHR